MELQNIPISEVTPSPMNPRKTFDEETLKELADNIRQQGLLQPITVRPIELSGSAFVSGAKYELVCGERRFRALQSLNAEDAERWPTIAAIVREMDDSEAFDAMITENLQRKDVDPIEEAYAFGQLIEKGNTAEEVALRFGKSVRFVQDRVKLNSLIPELLLLVKEGRMTLAAALVISKFDEAMQRKFHSAYGSYISINKESATRFVDAHFMEIERSAWYVSKNAENKDFAGGCGRKCSECHLNTANANCLFWEMKEEVGRCTNRDKYEAKHIAYLLAFLEQFDSEIVREGEVLEYGKIVLIDSYRPWNDDGRRVHDAVLKAVKEKGYEVVDPYKMFNGRCWYGEDDERLQEKYKAGEIYRCVDLIPYNLLPSPNLVYYNIKKANADDTTKGNVAPTEVVNLVGKYKRNIDIYNETLGKNYGELANKLCPIKRRGGLVKDEQMAFDMYILSNLSREFLSNHYHIGCDLMTRPTVKQLKEIATNNADDRDMWYREYIRVQLSKDVCPDSINACLSTYILPLWDSKEYEGIGQKAIQSLRKKNAKIKERLEELGYDVQGNKLVQESDNMVQEVKPPLGKTFGNRTPMMTQFLEMKAKHPDAIILFRNGDFYETYEDDAKAISEILNLNLVTRRESSTVVFTLCGFPHHCLDDNLPKLIRAGHRVAICEHKDS